MTVEFMGVTPLPPWNSGLPSGDESSYESKLSKSNVMQIHVVKRGLSGLLRQ